MAEPSNKKLKQARSAMARVARPSLLDFVFYGRWMRRG
jgi:hypothetical protein